NPRETTEERGRKASASLSAALHQQDWGRRMYDLYEVVNRMGPDEIPGAIEFARHLPPEHRNAAITALMGHWAEFDAGAAAKYALTFVDRELRIFTVGSVLETWTLTDPDAAMAWVAQLPAASQHEAVRYVAATLARSDPARALQFVANFAEP